MNIREELDSACPNLTSFAKTASIIIVTGLASAYSENNDMRIVNECYDLFTQSCKHEEAVLAIRKLQTFSSIIQANRMLEKIKEN